MRFLLSFLILALAVPSTAFGAVVRNWNGQTEDIGGGQKQTTLNVGWVNYMDENEVFQPIDTTWRQFGPGFIMDNAPFTAFAPGAAPGAAVFTNSNRFSPARKAVIEDAPVAYTILPQGPAPVLGRIASGTIHTRYGVMENVQYIEYPEAWPGADLIYYVTVHERPTLEKLIRVKSATSTSEFSFNITAPGNSNVYKNSETKRNARNEDSTASKMHIRDTGVARGISMMEPMVWNEEGQREFASTTITTNNRGYTLTKDVSDFMSRSQTFPAWTDSTFYPDEDAESTSVDGNVAFWNGTVPSDLSWDDHHDRTSGSTVRDALAQSGGALGATGCGVGSGGNGSYEIMRCFFLFDTSDIPDGDTISAATLSLYAASIQDSDNDSDAFIAVVDSNPASTTALAADDYDQVGDAIDNPTEMHDSGQRKDITSISTSAYTVWTLNSTGIANIPVDTSIAKFGVRSGHDIVDIRPVNGGGGATGFKPYYAEQTGTSQDPLLTVTHSAGGGGGDTIVPVQNIYWW